MKNLLIYINLVIFITVFSACSDYNQFFAYDVNSDSFQFLNVYGPESIQMSIDQEKANSVIVSDSIILDIPKHTFVNHMGELPDSEVNIVFKVYREIPSFISSDLSFVLDAKRLIGVQSLFYINAFDSKGSPLFMAENKNLLIKYPVTNPAQEFDLFVPLYGEENELSQWIETEEDIVINKVFKEEWILPNEEVSSGYIFRTDKMRWITMGYGISNDHKALIEVESEGWVNAENSRVFVISNEHKSLHKLEWNEERHAFCDLKGVMPVGSTCKILFLGQNGDYFCGIEEMLLNEENTIRLEIKQTNESAILELIETL